MRAAVVGASGYAGAEVLRLCASHPDLEVVVAAGETAAGARIAEHLPALAAAYPTMVLEPTAAVLDASVDVAFLALPHGLSQGLAPALLESGATVVDLAGDFRLRDAGAFEAWYHQAHAAPGLLARAVYGLVERHRDELPGATLIAVPGCYPTAAALALGPFVDDAAVEPEGVVVSALSGASGAGRALSERLHFPRLVANAEAYGLFAHRHTPEMEQELGVSLLFTPHLVPAARGLLVTAFARPARPLTTEVALAALRDAYAADPFVVVVDEPPRLKDPVGSNLCFVSARVDERTGWLVAMASIDNLIKGAAGQAIQAWNVATGRPEGTGLPATGVTP